MLKAIKNKWFLYRKISRSQSLSFASKLACVDDKFSKPVVLCRGKNAAHNFIKIMLEEFGYSKKVIKNHFKKNLIMTEKKRRKCSIK